MGEGSGIVILEDLDHALARGARMYGEIAGYGATCAAHGITAAQAQSWLDEFDPPVTAIKVALEDAGLAHDDIDYIVEGI